MRSIACALGAIILLLVCSQNSVAAESDGSRWWPFGQRDKTADDPTTAIDSATTPLPSSSGRTSTTLSPTTEVPSPSTQPAAAAPVSPDDEKWMLKSRKGKVGWPRLTMPKSGPFARQEPTDAATRNSWVEPTPAPPKPSPFKPLSDGAHKVSQGTKNAWRKTVDVLTPGEATEPRTKSTNSQIAKRDVEPPFWKRMFTSKEEEVQPPQTVPQWMAQRRLEP